MAYTPPSGSAANLQLGTGYVVPAGSAADLSFFVGYQVTGFSTTQMGAPSLAFIADGFSTTQHGQHYRRQNLALYATGGSVSTFGRPTLKFDPSGIHSTQFGSPLSAQYSPAQPVMQKVRFGIHHTNYALSTHLICLLEDGPASPANDNVVFTLPLATSWCDAAGFQPTQFGEITVPKTVKGFSPTVFGDAYSPYLQTLSDVTLGQVTGFKPGSIPIRATGWQNVVHLGTPTLRCVQSATGNQPIKFGGPNTRLFATGGSTTAFGVATGWSHFNAETIGRVTKWNYPYVAYVAHPLLLDADGFVVAKVGFPQRISLTFKPENIFVSAKGFKPTQFSTPASTFVTAVQAGGSTSTAFGTPTKDQVYATTGFSTPALFGQATSSFSASAAGFRTPAYAAPTHRRAQPAASTYRAVRWGMPVAERSNTFKTYGINRSGRFGQPRSTQRFNYPATGMCNTLFGTHTSFEMRRATMIPPTLQFGKPLLKRTPLC